MRKIINIIKNKIQNYDTFGVKFTKRLFILSLLILAILGISNIWSSALLNRIQVGLILLLVLYIIGVAILAYIKVVLCGAINFRKCGIALFDQIDKEKRTYLSDPNSYERIVGVINYYYREDGEADRLAKDNIMNLYKRVEYLEKQEKVYNYAFEMIMGISASVVASFAFIYFDLNGDDLSRFSVLFIGCAMFLFLMALPFYKKGHNNSYIYQVDRYELKLLDEKINKLHNSFANEIDEK